MNMKLRAAREESGKTQQQVAKISGITERSYQRIELGVQDPKVSNAIRIADALNSDVKTLFSQE